MAVATFLNVAVILQAPATGVRKLLNSDVLESSSPQPALLVAALLLGILVALIVWWISERKIGRERRKLAALYRLDEDLIAASDRQEMVAIAAQGVREVSRAASANVYILDRINNCLKSTDGSVEIPLDKNPSEPIVKCVRSRTASWKSVTNTLLLPVVHRDDVRGVLEVTTARTGVLFDEDERAALEHVARQIGSWLHTREERRARQQVMLARRLANEGPVSAGADLPAMPDVTSSPLTLLLVDSNPSAIRELIASAGRKGHRAVAATPPEAADMAQRFPFDAIFWSVRSGSAGWAEAQERILVHVGIFVLISDVFDEALAKNLEASGGFLMSRPVSEQDLDKVLQRIERLVRS